VVHASACRSAFPNASDENPDSGNAAPSFPVRGIVYRATDRYSGDTVALKLLHADRDAGGSHESERFAREAQLLSEVRHPGIIQPCMRQGAIPRFSATPLGVQRSIGCAPSVQLHQ
jgi:hypothetical protein